VTENGSENKSNLERLEVAPMTKEWLELDRMEQ